MPTINRCGGGGDSIKEPYDFPLSMQTATPTPVNTNHIWIHNDTKMRFGIDEAIRATDWNGSDMYYGIVDSTDNNFIQIEGPKTLTDGSHVPLNNRHQNRDDAPWHLGWTQYAKKNGLYYYSDNYSKWPRIYSRIGGVIDMEDAQRWDGSAWQWLSQKGSYLAVGRPTVDSPLTIYNRAGDNLYKHSDLSSTPAAVRAVKWSKDGNYIACGHTTSPYLSIYKKVGDLFEQLTLTAHVANPVYALSFSPDGNYLAVGTQSTLDIYKKQTDGSWAYLTSPNTGPQNTGCDWSPDSQYLIASFYTGPYLARWRRTNDTFTSVTCSISETTSGAAIDPHYSSDGQYVVVGCGVNSASMHLFRTGDDTTWTLVQQLASGTFRGSAPRFVGNYILFAGAYAGGLFIVPWSSSGFGTVSDSLASMPSYSGSFYGNYLAVSSSGDKIAIPTGTGIKMYALSGTTLTPLPDPDVSPGNNISAIDFLN